MIEKQIEKELKKQIIHIIVTYMEGGNLSDIIDFRMPKLKELFNANRTNQSPKRNSSRKKKA